MMSTDQNTTVRLNLKCCQNLLQKCETILAYREWQADITADVSDGNLKWFAFIRKSTFEYSGRSAQISEYYAL
jgi:hypothetical protein